MILRNLLILHTYILFTERPMECDDKMAESSEERYSSEGVLTVILPTKDRSDLLVRCTPCQKIFVGMEGWKRHKKVTFRFQ